MGTRKKRAKASTAAIAEVSPTEQMQHQARELLGRLPTVKLRRLLADKKVLHRSRCRSKVSMINALQRVMDVKEIEAIVEGLPLPAATIAPAPCSTGNDGDNAISCVEGKRWNDPVMAIDIHKVPLAWAIVNPEGLVQEAVTENTIDGVQTIITACHVHGVKMVAMESTAEYWLLPYWLLTEAGIPVMVVNALQVKAIMGVKTDKLDARRIAFALRDGRLRPSIACNREQYALRKDMRQLVKYVEQSTQSVEQLDQIIQRASAPEVVTKALTSHRGRSIMASLPGCKTRDELMDVVTVAYSKYKGKIEDPTSLSNITDAFWTFMTRVKENGDMERYVMELDDYTVHAEKAWSLQRNGLLYAKQHPAFLDDLRTLLTFTGIDVRIALPMLAEIVDIRYFKTGAKLSKWSGIVPGTKQSGYRKRINGKIYKAGNKYLRRAAWLVAQHLLRMHGHPIRNFMLHLINDKHKSKMKAITAGAHKVLVIIHAMLSRKLPFTIIANEDELKRQERCTRRKWSKLDRLIDTVADADIMPRVVTRLKARIKSCANMEQIVTELAASLLGNDVAVHDVIDAGGG
nr:IS110 family transposase [Candidatus Sigynarchaeota archaeon]